MSLLSAAERGDPDSLTVEFGFWILASPTRFFVFSFTSFLSQCFFFVPVSLLSPPTPNPSMIPSQTIVSILPSSSVQFFPPPTAPIHTRGCLSFSSLVVVSTHSTLVRCRLVRASASWLLSSIGMAWSRLVRLWLLSPSDTVEHSRKICGRGSHPISGPFTLHVRAGARFVSNH